MTVPRSGWVKPESDRRLSDLVSVGLLTRVFPADVVDAVVAAAGRTELRQRALPARVVTYFAIGMALHSEGSYEDVFAQLTDGLSWTTGWEQSWSPPTKSAIFQARSRLGYEPLRDLFARVARPVAGEDTPGSWLAGRRLVAIDGTCVDVPDTPANADFSGGRPQVAASSPRSRKRGWSRWPNAARTRSSTPCSGRVAARRSRWPERWQGGWSRECWCSPTAVSTASNCGVRLPGPVLTCYGA